MAYRSASYSCTVYQSWIYQQTGGSAGGSKLCSDTRGCTISQVWAWDNEGWVTNGSATNNSSATIPYGPDADGYSGTLNRQSVSGTPSPPSYSGSYFNEQATTTASGTASYSATLTKSDTRTYGWATNGSQTHDATSSKYYDDGSYAGWLYLYSVVGSPPTPTGTSTVGSTTVTSASGTAYYDGDVPLKVPNPPGNFRTTSIGTDSINFAWDAVSNVDSYNLEVYLAGTATWVFRDYSIPSSQLSRYVFGLFSDTSYDAKLWATNSSGNSVAVWKYNITTQSEVVSPPTAPTNLNAVATQTGVTLTWTAVSGATSYSAEIYLQGTSTVVKSAYTFTGTSVEFSGLTQGTAYTAKVYGNNTAGTGSASFKGFSTTGTPRPSNWSWTSLVSSRATNPNVAYTGTIPLALVNASDWNNFTTRINAFRAYKGLGAYTFTSVSSQQAFTNTIYQQAVSAISSMTTVSQPSGYYSKLIALRDALNSIT